MSEDDGIYIFSATDPLPWWRRWLAFGNHNSVLVSIIMGLFAIFVSFLISSAQVNVAKEGISASYNVADYNLKSESLREILRADSAFGDLAMNAKSYSLVSEALSGFCPDAPKPCDRERINKFIGDRTAILNDLAAANRDLAVVLVSSKHLWKYDLEELKREAEEFTRNERHILLQLKLRIGDDITKSEFQSILKSLKTESQGESENFIDQFSEGYFQASFDLRKTLSSEIAEVVAR